MTIDTDVRPVGRPPIGPKAQTNIPPTESQLIKREAARRGVRESVVVREIILIGCAVRYPDEVR